MVQHAQQQYGTVLRVAFADHWLIVCASRNPTSPHQTSGLVSNKLGQRFGDGPGVDLGGFWRGLRVVEGGWLTIG